MIRRLQRGFPHCVDRTTSDSGDRPEGSLLGKLRKLREIRGLRELKESLSITCCEHLKGWSLGDSEAAERVSSLCGQSDE